MPGGMFELEFLNAGCSLNFRSFRAARIAPRPPVRSPKTTPATARGASLVQMFREGRVLDLNVA